MANSPKSWLAFSLIDLSPNVLRISSATLYVSLSMTFCRTCRFSWRKLMSRRLFRSIFELKYQDTQYLRRMMLQWVEGTWQMSNGIVVLLEGCQGIPGGGSWRRYSQNREEEQRQGIDQTIPPGRWEEVKVEDYECHDIGANRGNQKASCELPLGLPGGYSVTL